MKNALSNLEALESRIAPATLMNPTTVTFIDADGDLVTVKTTRGTFQLTDADGGEPGDNFTFVAEGIGQRLLLIDVSGDSTFTRANLTVTAKVTAGVGGAATNVQTIDATGVDLGTVKVAGDLGALSAGNANEPAPGLAGLHARSLGLVEPGTITVAGRVGAINIPGDVHASILVMGGLTASIGSIKIGGSLLGNSISGNISAEGSIGSISIAGDLRGGGNLLYGTGKIESGESIGTIDIGGSVVGGARELSAVISAQGSIGQLKIAGDFRGGSGERSASVYAPIIKVAKIGGSIIGGGGFRSGEMFIGKTSSFSIGGSLLGGDGERSGLLSIGSFGAVKIAGDLLGGASPYSGAFSGTTGKNMSLGGSIIASTNVGAQGNGSLQMQALGGLKIGGSIEGGAAAQSGQVQIAERLGTISVAGSVHAGTGFSAGSIRGGAIGTLTVGGGLAGTSSDPLLITAITEIGELRVGGSVSFARILAGYNQTGSTGNGDGGIDADAKIGGVKIGGDWIASSLAAGAVDGGVGFGSIFQVKIQGPGTTNQAGVISRISRIVILGQVHGSPVNNDAFGFGAQELGQITVSGTRLPVIPGIANDLFGIYLGATSDFRHSRSALVSETRAPGFLPPKCYMERSQTRASHPVEPFRDCDGLRMLAPYEKSALPSRTARITHRPRGALRSYRHRQPRHLR